MQKNIRGRSTRSNVKRRADAARESLRVDAGALQKQLSLTAAGEVALEKTLFAEAKEKK